MQTIQECLAGLKLGAPQVHRNLALFPLTGRENRAAGYVLLDEALERQLARVTEVSAEGSVPELAFENASAEKILLVDGDELVGAKQNRVLNLTILVGGGKRVVIPVSCVEQGRWAYRRPDFAPAGRALFARARAKKMQRVSESLRNRGRAQADQGEVWGDVADKAKFLRVDSPTLAMSDFYEQSAARLADYESAFRAEPGQRGAVVAIDGKVTGLELFDSAQAFARYLAKLVRSYALDALETANGQHLAPPAAEVERFLERLRAASVETFAALGEGEDLRLSGERLSGGALAADGRIVHLAGFAAA